MSQAPFKREECLAGGYIPRQLADQLALLAMFHNTSRSEIIRTLITERVENDKQVPDIIKALAKRLISSWEEMREKNRLRAPTFAEFCRNAQSILDHKKISTVHSQMILIKAKEIYDKNYSTQNK